MSIWTIVGGRRASKYIAFISGTVRFFVIKRYGIGEIQEKYIIMKKKGEFLN
jgi:hypothetical protein